MMTSTSTFSARSLGARPEVHNVSDNALIHSQYYEGHKMHEEAEVVDTGLLPLGEANHFDSCYEHKLSLESIKNDLLNHCLDTSAVIDYNRGFLEKCQNVYNKLPCISAVKRQKLIIPEFEEIEVEKNDTAEIKKFIRKVNYEMLGFHCNHTSFDKKYETTVQKISALYESECYTQYKQFIESLCKHIWQIRNRDSKGKRWDYPECFPSGNDVQRILNSIIKINGQVALINADANPVCSKCKASVRRYEYVLREIQRMRDERYEQHEIEDKYTNGEFINMTEFMMRNYPTIDRFELKDVRDKYKKVFNKSLTYAELKPMIEDTEMFTVTNSHGTHYVNRI